MPDAVSISLRIKQTLLGKALLKVSLLCAHLSLKKTTLFLLNQWRKCFRIKIEGGHPKAKWGRVTMHKLTMSEIAGER